MAGFHKTVFNKSGLCDFGYAGGLEGVERYEKYKYILASFTFLVQRAKD